MKITSETLKFIGECFLRDINIQARLTDRVNKRQYIDQLSQILIDNSNSTKFVYTAFDGDHFHFLQNMRKCVLSHRHFPANPESVLGYKNVVTKYNNKRKVLIDDLSLLKHCDELWLFTDFDPTLEGALNLPEGVLIELTYFLKRHKSIVKFVPLTPLLKNDNVHCQKFEFLFEDIEKILSNSNRSKVLEMANNNYQVDKELKNFKFFISDPLDFKYSEWLRENKNETEDIALVPGLASRITDANNNVERIGKIVLSWASLINFSSSCYLMTCFDSRRNESIISEALKECYIYKSKNERINKKQLQVMDWETFKIPKKMQRREWPITIYEANLNK